MRIGSHVPLVGTTWDWDIDEIMERSTSDLESHREDHYCGDHDCADGCVATDRGLAWDDLIECRREDHHYDWVVESIIKHGFTVPLTARLSWETGEVELGDGHHRLAAALELGMTSVPVVMVTPEDFISRDSFNWGYDDTDCNYLADEMPPPPNCIITRRGTLVPILTVTVQEA